MSKSLLTSRGRIGPLTFLKGLAIITLIFCIFSQATSINYDAGFIFEYLKLVLLFPLTFLVIKRLHDGGKSGWWSILWVLITLIVVLLVSAKAEAFFGGQAYVDMMSATQAMAEKDLGVKESYKQGQVILEQFGPQVKKNSALPVAVVAFFMTMILGSLLNLFVKSDIKTNKFGAPPISK